MYDYEYFVLFRSDYKSFLKSGSGSTKSAFGTSVDSHGHFMTRDYVACVPTYQVGTCTKLQVYWLRTDFKKSCNAPFWYPFGNQI